MEGKSGKLPVEPIEFEFTKQADELFRVQYNLLEKLTHKTINDDLRASYAKLAGCGARIALIFGIVEWAHESSHESESPPKFIDVGAIKGAIPVVDWLVHEYESDRIPYLVNLKRTNSD